MGDISIEKLLLFAAFIFPGFVSLAAHQLRLPRKDSLLKDQVLEAVAFSILNFAVVVWPAYKLVGQSNSGVVWWQSWLAILLGFAVIPFLLGWLSVSAIRYAGSRGWITAPQKTSFDWVFGLQKGCWVKVRLNDDSWVGGRFDKSNNSFASAFPEPGHLYIGELWRLDDAGDFKEPLTDGPGLILRPTDYKYVYTYLGQSDERDEA